MNSDTLRSQVLKLLKKLPLQSKTDLSAHVVSSFLSALKRQGIGSEKLGWNVGLYRSRSDEFDLHSLSVELKKRGCHTFFPRMAPDQCLEFVEMISLPVIEIEQDSSELSGWEKNHFGIQEPHSELKCIDPKKLDIIFVPGVAFGQSGERIGRGKGYYDRFLPQVPHALRVALAFDFQVFPSLPQLATDQPVHWILTETRDVRLLQVATWLNERGGI